MSLANLSLFIYYNPLEVRHCTISAQKPTKLKFSPFSELVWCLGFRVSGLVTSLVSTVIQVYVLDSIYVQTCMPQPHRSSFHCHRCHNNCLNHVHTFVQSPQCAVLTDIYKTKIGKLMTSIQGFIKMSKKCSVLLSHLHVCALSCWKKCCQFTEMCNLNRNQDKYKRF